MTFVAIGALRVRLGTVKQYTTLTANKVVLHVTSHSYLTV